ncbi:MAG: helix-turn-helix domain-containing protein [Gammaproteobacteria bacterium]
MGTLEAVEQGYILKVLEGANWMIEGPQEAAATLGLHPSTLRSRMQKLAIKTQALEFAIVAIDDWISRLTRGRMTYPQASQQALVEAREVAVEPLKHGWCSRGGPIAFPLAIGAAGAQRQHVGGDLLVPPSARKLPAVLDHIPMGAFNLAEPIGKSASMALW